MSSEQIRQLISWLWTCAAVLKLVRVVFARLYDLGVVTAHHPALIVDLHPMTIGAANVTSGFLWNPNHVVLRRALFLGEIEAQLRRISGLYFRVQNRSFNRSVDEKRDLVISASSQAIAIVMAFGVGRHRLDELSAFRLDL